MELLLIVTVLQEFVPDAKYIDESTIQIGSRLFFINNGMIRTPSSIGRYFTIRGFYVFLRDDNYINVSDFQIEQMCKKHERLKK